jgi:hypothetical protein
MYSHFVFSIWRMQKICSCLLRLIPRWWSPTISSVYGLNLERRIFNNILYEVHCSDFIWYLLQPVLSPILWIGTIIDSFCWPGNFFLFQMELMSLWIADIDASFTFCLIQFHADSWIAVVKAFSSLSSWSTVWRGTDRLILLSSK